MADLAPPEHDTPEFLDLPSGPAVEPMAELPNSAFPDPPSVEPLSLNELPSTRPVPQAALGSIARADTPPAPSGLPASYPVAVPVPPSPSLAPILSNAPAASSPIGSLSGLARDNLPIAYSAPFRAPDSLAVALPTLISAPAPPISQPTAELPRAPTSDLPAPSASGQRRSGDTFAGLGSSTTSSEPSAWSPSEPSAQDQTDEMVDLLRAIHRTLRGGDSGSQGRDRPNYYQSRPARQFSPSGRRSE